MTDEKAPPRLRRLEIRDFRAIDHLELEFPEPDDHGGSVMVLAGDNGVGKSSVLDAVLLVLGRVDLVAKDMAPPRELVRQGARDFSLRAVFDGRISMQANREFVEESQAMYARRPGWWTSDDLSDAEFAVGAAIDPPMRVAPARYSVESFSARREPADGAALTQDGSRAGLVREERRLTELARRLSNAFTRNGRAGAAFRRIERFLQAFMGESWSLDVIFRDDREGSDPIVVARDGDLPLLPNGTPHTFESVREHAAKGAALPRVIPIDRLSSGQMAILAMTLPFVFGTRPVDIALIDEPEQHLHPSWQRAFLGALRKLSPSTQFIVATHSPEILDSVASYERRRLVRDDAPNEPLAATAHP